MTFNKVVESMKTLSTEEKEEIKSLIDHYLIEGKREEIYQNYLVCQQREKEGKLNYSSDINKLMNSLEQE